MTDKSTNKLRWNTTRRVRKAASMKDNTNAQVSKFSSDLTRKFGNDPELAKWIADNAAALDSPNADGVAPLSESQIADNDSYGLRRDYRDERRVGEE